MEEVKDKVEVVDKVEEKVRVKEEGLLLTVYAQIVVQGYHIKEVCLVDKFLVLNVVLR